MSRSSLIEITDLVDDFLYEWRHSGESSSPAAERLVSLILGHEQVIQALREFRRYRVEGVNPFGDRDHLAMPKP